MRGILLVIAASAILIPASGCELERRDDPTPPAAPPAVELVPAPAAEIPFEEETWPAHALEVVNETDRQVAIIAVVDGRVQELGSAAPQESTQFELRAESGATVQLEARDTGDRLVSETTLLAGQTVLHWTVN